MEKYFEVVIYLIEAEVFSAKDITKLCTHLTIRLLWRTGNAFHFAACVFFQTFFLHHLGQSNQDHKPPAYQIQIFYQAWDLELSYYSA